ncbi:MAG: exo-beta-N-acetylmuramidase NamZ domain-containing protein, partial [Pseudomonadota bacterium]
MGLTAAIDDLDFSLLEGRRLGLLTNSAARTASGQTTLDTLRSHPSAEINCIFTPEHGLTATAEPAQPVPDGQSAGTRVITLYGARLQPDPDHLNDIDLVVIDLPGLGVRCFTYLATAWRTITVAAEARTPVLILDRPNSLGRSIELPIGQARAKGLLCPLTVPLRHGLTLGEILRMAATEAHIPQPDIALCAPVAEPGP